MSSKEFDPANLNPPQPGQQAIQPVRRHLILRGEKPTEIFLPPNHSGIARIFDIIPAFEPPDEPWWQLTVREFSDDTQVTLRPIGTYPPDAALGFEAYTYGNDQAAHQRLERVMANVLILSNVQIDPEPALHLIHRRPEGTTS